MISPHIEPCDSVMVFTNTLSGLVNIFFVVFAVLACIWTVNMLICCLNLRMLDGLFIYSLVDVWLFSRLVGLKVG